MWGLGQRGASSGRDQGALWLGGDLGGQLRVLSTSRIHFQPPSAKAAPPSLLDPGKEVAGLCGRCWNMTHSTSFEQGCQGTLGGPTHPMVVPPLPPGEMFPGTPILTLAHSAPAAPLRATGPQKAGPPQGAAGTSHPATVSSAQRLSVAPSAPV